MSQWQQISCLLQVCACMCGHMTPGESSPTCIRLCASQGFWDGCEGPDLPVCPELFAWPPHSSLTGEMMSNWMGVFGATKESREREEREERAGESEPWLLLRVALGRPGLRRRHPGDPYMYHSSITASDRMILYLFLLLLCKYDLFVFRVFLGKYFTRLCCHLLAEA